MMQYSSSAREREREGGGGVFSKIRVTLESDTK